MLSDLHFRLRALLHRPAVEQELDDELRFHIEQEALKYQRSGIERNEAIRRARIALGGVSQVAEHCRDARGTNLFENFLRNLRYGIRALRSTPSFTVVALLSLAIGIGANTAVFTVVNATLLRSLAVDNPDALISLYSSADEPVNNIWRRNSNTVKDPKTGKQLSDTFSLTALQRFQNEAKDAADVFGFYSPGRVGVTDAAGTRTGHLTLVSGNYFQAAGVRVALGRPLTPQDDRARAAVVVITASFWERAFQNNPSILGSTVKMNGIPAAIVGVVAPGFRGMAAAGFDGPSDLFGPLGAMDVLAPLQSRHSKKPLTAPDYWWIHLMARRSPGVSTESAQARLTTVFQNEAKSSGLPHLEQMKNPGIVVRDGSRGTEALRSAVGEPLKVLLGVAAIVLVLACLNVAVLMLARSAARHREIAVRVSVGASRGHILGQLMTESLLLSIAGGAAGWLVAWWGAHVIGSLITANFNNADLDLAPDARILLFTAAVAVLTGIFFGIAPALKALKVDIAPNLRQTVQTTSGTARFATGKVLIAAQVALSVLLLAGSGLLLRTLWNLQKIDAGFQRDRLLTFRADAGQLGKTPEQAFAVHQRIVDELKSTPGVVSAAAVSHTLISGWHNGTQVRLPGAPENKSVDVLSNTVTPDFFETVGMPLVAGRAFDLADQQASRRPVVINQIAAKKLFGDEPPVGKILVQHSRMSRIELEVIGVSRDAKYDNLRKQIVPTMFDLYRSEPDGFTGRAFVVRTFADPSALAAAVRKAVASVEPDLAVTDMKTQQRLIDDSLYRERLFAWLLTLFGIFSLVLAAIGLYGVASYSAVRRTPEVGVRVALGATANQVLTLFIGQTLRPVLAGAVAGVIGSYIASKVVASLLFGVDRLDIPTFLSVLAVLLTIAAIAATIPAWRATRIEPMTALRTD